MGGLDRGDRLRLWGGVVCGRRAFAVCDGASRVLGGRLLLFGLGGGFCAGLGGWSGGWRSGNGGLEEEVGVWL